MPYQYPEIKKFSGLRLQKNSFNVSDGSLEIADNVVISKEDIISKRRGFYKYFTPSGETLNALTYYNQKLIAIFEDKVRYFSNTGSSPNLTGSATTLTGVTVAVAAPRKSKFVQSNKNLYFTTDNGVLKLEDYNSSVFSSGVPPALDLTGSFYNSVAYSIAPDTVTGYRVLFGRKDGNKNVLLSAPSDMVFLTNGYTSSSWSRTSSTVTVTVSSGHGLLTGQIVKINNSVSGSPNVANGSYSITGTTSTTFTFTEGSGSTSGTLDWSVAKAVRLEFSIPSEITSTTQAFFYQVYRTSQASSSASLPNQDFKLVDEVLISSGQISNKVIYFNDLTDSVLVSSSEELYTNTNSREGETQANDRAPKCEDLCLYEQMIFHANCTTRHLLSCDLVDVSALVDGSYIEVKVDATTRRYVGRTGVGNSTVSATASGTSTITVTYTAHNVQTNDVIYVSNVSGSVPQGQYTVTGTTTNTFTFTSSGNTATTLDFSVLKDSSAYGVFKIQTSSTLSVNLRQTAQGIIKAINRDSSSLIYAKYVSGPSDTPGKFRLTAKGFTGTVSLRASSLTEGQSFYPDLPDSFSTGTQVTSDSDNLQSSIFVSKIAEPEAVPIVNEILVGAKNKAILAARALRDSVIVLKEDGVFRVTGDSVSTLVVTALDTTVICVSKGSVDVLNNQVILLSNQGVCLVTESAVSIISRDIENVIQPILGNSNLETQTTGASYESERIYLLSTLDLNQNSITTTYCYNNLTQEWSKWDQLFKSAVLGDNDTLFLINEDNKIMKERKNQTKIDYCGQNYSTTVVSVASDKKSCLITSASAVPEVGDVLVLDNVFNKIISIVASGSDYDVGFSRDTNLEAGNEPILYSKFTATIKFSPIHLGKIGLMKQFSQFQVHIRDSNLSRMDISFASYSYGSSEIVTWSSMDDVGGFGYFSFGLEPFGQPDGILTTPGTENAPVVRVYVPKLAQRSTFIQPYLEHSVAGESMNIQAITFAVRSYKERVSR